MNKKLLTVAVAAGVAATSLAAIADVNVYGRVQAEWVSLENSAGLDQSEVNDPGMSRWGIKATEDLGNGLTGIAVLEYSAEPADSGAEGNRQQFVALKGNFGTVAMGTFNGVYKSIGAALDPFNATFLEARHNGGQAGGAYGNSGFLNSGIAWMSPTVSGISAQVIVIDESASGAGNDWQAAVQYKNGPMWGFIAHSENVGDGLNGTDASLTKIGGRMSMANHTFWVQWEDDDGGLNAPTSRTDLASTGIADPGTADGDILLIGYQMKLGKNAIVVQWGDSDYDTAAGSGNYMSIGARHSFSKTTSIYGGWRQTENDTAGTNDIDVFGFGIRKDF